MPNKRLYELAVSRRAAMPTAGRLRHGQPKGVYVVARLRRTLVGASVLGGLALVATVATPALAAPDTQPPTTPKNNHVTAFTETTVSLAWSRSEEHTSELQSLAYL